MQLNVAIYKCAVLSIGKITPPKYILRNYLLHTVKYIGVYFTNTLSFNIHIISGCRKCY